MDEQRYLTAHTENINHHDQNLKLDADIDVVRRPKSLLPEQEYKTSTSLEISDRQNRSPVKDEQIREESTLQPSVNVETNKTTITEGEHALQCAC